MGAMIRMLIKKNWKQLVKNAVKVRLIRLLIIILPIIIASATVTVIVAIVVMQ